MKVSLGMRLRDGPWGGGNLFGKSLVKHLSHKGIDVVYDLNDADIDIIILIDPRARAQSSSFTDVGIARYLLLRNPRAIVVHRINECDERKGTRGVNRRLLAANQLADHTVFIATWLKDLFLAQGLLCPETNVILNGADREIFHARGQQPWSGQGPIKLVTHHWGGNWMKGFDIYAKLDELLASKMWRNRIAFTYVGNLPPGYRFLNARYLTPLVGDDLADELRHHHAYISASQNEPGGMHHIEGAMCGLPPLFRNSGALPEYCKDFGVEFSANDFEAKLNVMIDRYPSLIAKIASYPYDSQRMVDAYFDLIEDLFRRRGEILSRRSGRRWQQWLVSRFLH